MRLFKCNTQTINLMVIDAPRHSWKVLPPKKWQVALTVASIILTAIVWSLT